MPQKVDVAAQMDILIKLQAIDSQIYALKSQKEKKPQELARLKADFESKSTALKQAEAKVTGQQLKKKEKEGALQTKEESIKKLQGQLYQIKTNKEYAAMQKEIEGHKADKSMIEDEILLLMEEIDRAKEGVAKEKQILVDEESKLKEQEKQVHAELEEIVKKLAELKTQRESVTPQVESGLLKKYERALLSRNGLAIVPVVNNACLGCNMDMPPQVINEIRMREKFIVCESCARFLYINEPA